MQGPLVSLFQSMYTYDLYITLFAGLFLDIIDTPWFHAPTNTPAHTAGRHVGRSSVSSSMLC